MGFRHTMLSVFSYSQYYHTILIQLSLLLQIYISKCITYIYMCKATRMRKWEYENVLGNVWDMAIISHTLSFSYVSWWECRSIWPISITI